MNYFTKKDNQLIFDKLWYSFLSDICFVGARETLAYSRKLVHCQTIDELHVTIAVTCLGDVYGIGGLISPASKMMTGSEFVVGKKAGSKDIVR